MPTYLYRCKGCEHEFEQFQKFVEDPLTECPECGQAIKRVIQPVGVVFKGSGWYINDSRKPAPESESAGPKAEAKSTDAASTDKPDKAADGGAAEKTAKSETKADAKAEPKEVKTKTAAPA